MCLALLPPGEGRVMELAAKEIGDFQKRQPQGRQVSLVNSTGLKVFDGMVVRMYRQHLDCMRILHPFVGKVVTLLGNQLIPVPVSEQPNRTVIELLEVPEMENKDCSPSAKNNE